MPELNQTEAADNFWLLSQAPDIERYEPCPVACALGNHPLVAPASSPEEFTRVHRVGVCTVGGVEVAITVFEAIDNGRWVLEPAKVNLYRDGSIAELFDIDPADAVALGRWLAHAGESAKGWRVTTDHRQAPAEMAALASPRAQVLFRRLAAWEAAGGWIPRKMGTKSMRRQVREELNEAGQNVDIDEAVRMFRVASGLSERP